VGRTGLRDGLDWAAGEARVQSGVGLKALTRAPCDGYGGLGLYFKTKWPRGIPEAVTEAMEKKHSDRGKTRA